MQVTIYNAQIRIQLVRQHNSLFRSSSRSAPKIAVAVCSHFKYFQNRSTFEWHGATIIDKTKPTDKLFTPGEENKLTL